jgi:N-acetylneuraminic acid mutarotase
MSQKNLIYIILWLLIQLLVVEINCQLTPFKPKGRNLHTTTLIDNKLYILGGFQWYYLGKDFFYLDVSVAFNTQNLLWNDLSNVNIIPANRYSASVKGGANNNTLFLYGGANNAVMDLVYTFNPQSNSWSIPKITGNIPFGKFGLSGIIDHKGIMYLWSGHDDANNKYVNDMLILDTINLVWGKGNLVGAPTGRINYGAVLLPDNIIIYMGKQVIPVFYYLLIFCQ